MRALDLIPAVDEWVLWAEGVEGNLRDARWLLGTVEERRTMPTEVSRERWLTPAEIEALITACRTSKNDLLARLVRVAVHTGLRLSELTCCVRRK